MIFSNRSSMHITESSEAALILLHYLDRNVPSTIGNRLSFRRESSKRWAVNELANELLNHPNKNAVDVTESLIGQLACMIYNSQQTNRKNDKILLYSDAIGALLKIENYFNEVCK